MTTEERLRIPVPKRMRGLQRDGRGYPVPFIVQRVGGVPYFTANDSRAVKRCVKEKRCAICGNKLDSVMWWVGGPNSAFHPRGAYIDTAMHYDCMEYALKVCPYLAAPKYAGIAKSHVANKITEHAQSTEQHIALMDLTQLPDRPSVFVAVSSRAYKIRLDGGYPYSHPVRPWIGVEYWEHGERLSDAAGAAIAAATMITLEHDAEVVQVL